MLKTKSQIRTISLIAAVLAFALLILTACGSAETKPEKTAPTQSASASQKTPDLPDPRAIKGLTTVPELKDPEVIDGKYEQKLPATITDFEGKEVTVNDTSRILALDLYGTLSRTVIALGYGKNIVGKTVSSTEEQLKDLPTVTENGHQLNVEAILALKPTLILVDHSIGPPEAIEQLRATNGVSVVLMDGERSFEKTGELTKHVAQALGVDEAGDALAKRTDEEIKAAEEKIKTWAPEKPLGGAFLYVRGKQGIFFILGSMSSSLLKSLGVRDLAGENDIRDLVPANAESLAKLNPEVIFAMTGGIESAGGMDSFMARPGVAQTTAGKNQRVVAIPDGIALSYGPQSGEVLLNIAKAIYGVK
ncbi:ABC transporter substrate-binding protein [Gleimia hominis]|uniref:ABC transporter substrate-binding protein n=1 Tax=Gleimia hominis TaxID=595468 RepID=A0ABU3ICJ8_9ACTO|nr:ABC transporter substrate-binding protein [Gleimia hominis]MDT3767988.1 ABC transporter substrate-binding protein [Gleimia hominis]